MLRGCIGRRYRGLALSLSPKILNFFFKYEFEAGSCSRGGKRRVGDRTPGKIRFLPWLWPVQRQALPVSAEPFISSCPYQAEAWLRSEAVLHGVGTGVGCVLEPGGTASPRSGPRSSAHPKRCPASPVSRQPGFALERRFRENTVSRRRRPVAPRRMC